MAETPPTDHEVRLRRLKFRSWHRGIKEMDLILGHFADEMLDGLSPADLDDYERLIEIQDITLYNWISGHEQVPAEFETPVFERIRSAQHLKAALWQQND